MFLCNTIITISIMTGIAAGQRDCSRDEYERCVSLADPLVKEAHLVFPDNLNDIDLVCKTWNMFVNCLRAYTDNCFTDQQRTQFNRAVESPIESVHQMCMQPSYQKEYLHYAPCIKSTIIGRVHCGPHYNLLVDQVEQGEVISKSTLCCSHDRFKQCVIRETRRMCDSGISDGPASRFAAQIIDKALKFLQDQCINYIPNSGDCISQRDSIISYSDRLNPSSIISTASSEVYPWSTTEGDLRRREYESSRYPKLSTPSRWSPSSLSPSLERDHSDNSGSVLPTQHLGTRTRPASYGRSKSWSPDSVSSSTLATNTAPMLPGMVSTPGTVREQFATRPSWDVQSGINRGVSAPPFKSTDFSTTTSRFEVPYSPVWNPSTLPSTETWYPAAGNQLSNEVDEPNQLGLKKLRNTGNTWRVSCGRGSLLLSSLILMMFKIFLG